MRIAYKNIRLDLRNSLCNFKKLS